MALADKFTSSDLSITITGDGSTPNPYDLITAAAPAATHPFITVAANDTPEPFKSAATYVCDGTTDQVEIQSALDTYPGREVILLPGTFVTTATILLDQNESLTGSGRETTTISCSAADYVVRCVDPPGAANGDNTVAHMTLLNTAVNGGCLDVEAGSERNMFFDLNCFATGATSVNRVVFLRGSFCTFVDNTVSVAGDYWAILISGGAVYRIAHNIIHGPVAFDNNSQIFFDNNYCTMPVASGVKSGIETSTAANNHQISNNKIISPRGHGISLGGNDNLVTDNMIQNVGQATANTYDGIRFDGDRNVAQGNSVLGTSHRYAAVVVSGTSDDNWITNNRLTAGGTGIILDSGATTSVAPGNYPGDLNPGAWTAWTPTLANLTLGDGSSIAAYQRVGRTIHYRWRFLLGSTSAVGAGPTFTLPVAPAAAYTGQDPPVGFVHLMDQGSGTYHGIVHVTTGSTAALRPTDTGGAFAATGNMDATVPFTWVATDAIFAWGTYEAAS